MRTLLQSIFVILLFLFDAIAVYSAGHQANSHSRLAADKKAAMYRTGVISRRVLHIPLQLEHKVYVKPEKYLKKLVHFLTEGTDDPYLKVKRIHDWITRRIAYYYYYKDGRSFCRFTLPDRGVYIGAIFARYVPGEKGWTQVYKFILKKK